MEDRMRKRSLLIRSIVSALIFAGIPQAGSAWIPSTSCRCRVYQDDRTSAKRQRKTPLLFAKKEPNDRKKEQEEDEEKTASGFFSRFTSSTDKKDDKNKVAAGEDDESSGIFRSIANRFSSRETKEERRRAEQERELAGILEKEGFNDPSAYFKFLNTTGLTSMLRNIKAGLDQASDEIRNVRPEKTALSAEELRLEELRKRAAAEKRRRIIAKQLADQRATERRRKKDEEQEEARKAKRASAESQDRIANKDGSEDSETRFNPLSVVQNYVSAFIDSMGDEEEWLVVAPKTRISPGEMVPITAAGLDLLLVASKDGSALYCVENSCPHLGTPLEVGMLERRPIEMSIANSVSAMNATAKDPSRFEETDITKLLSQDGCEDCIVCPLHRTAFALESGEVRGEWCPYPPVIGKMMGAVKTKSTLPTFDVRTKGKNIEVRINTPLTIEGDKKQR